MRFDEAIDLFQQYVREFFNNIIPVKMSCVDKVGGIYTLSKSWKNRYESVQSAVRNHDPDVVGSEGYNSSANIGIGQGGGMTQTQTQMQMGETNNFTALRR